MAARYLREARAPLLPPSTRDLLWAGDVTFPFWNKSKKKFMLSRLAIANAIPKS